MEPEPLATLLRVGQALETLGIPYCVGGSLASSFYGIPRATNDVDLIVALRDEQIAPLVAALGDAFMIDPQAAGVAIAHGRSFNIIAYETLDKVDFFVAADQPWPRQQLQRRQAVTLPNNPGAARIYFASAEDVILAKLVWYRQGGETSERQWRDLVSVLTIQAGELDRPYLRRWAEELGVLDLLTRAIAVSPVGDTAG